MDYNELCRRFDTMLYPDQDADLVRAMNFHKFRYGVPCGPIPAMSVAYKISQFAELLGVHFEPWTEDSLISHLVYMGADLNDQNTTVS